FVNPGYIRMYSYNTDEERAAQLPTNFQGWVSPTYNDNGKDSWQIELPTNEFGGSSGLPISIDGRYVRVQFTEDYTEYMNVAEVEVYGTPVVEPISNTSTRVYAHNGTNLAAAVDGRTNGNSDGSNIAETTSQEGGWIEFDLGAPRAVEGVKIFNRTDANGGQLEGFVVMTSLTPFPVSTNSAAVIASASWASEEQSLAYRREGYVSVPSGRLTRYVRLQMTGDGARSFQLPEVQIFGEPLAPASAPPLAARNRLPDGFNLALGRELTTSVQPAGSTTSTLNDGITDQAAAPGTDTELALAKDGWLTLDLGEVLNVESIVLYPATGAAATNLDAYTVLLSEAALPNGPINVPVASGAGYWSSGLRNDAGQDSVEFAIPGAFPAQYLRIQLPGDAPRSLQLAEIKVIGRAVPRDITNLITITPGPRVRNFDAARLTDGLTPTEESSDSHVTVDEGKWVIIDLGSTYGITELRIDQVPLDISGLSDRQRLQQDGKSGVVEVEVSKTPFPADGSQSSGTSYRDALRLKASIAEWELEFPVQTKGRYLRLRVTADSELPLKLSEVRIKGYAELSR
ncbi:MAG: discoidin domain-containing protein, partial [Bacteroidota bacterium]